VPAQFKATNTTTPTIGIERLYLTMQFQLYHAPLTATDFIAPSIWQVTGTNTTSALTFNILVSDDTAQAGASQVARVVVLYRTLNGTTWKRAELTYNASTQTATGTVSGEGAIIEYFVQAVDTTGNVALALDHGNPFVLPVSGATVYLPLVVR
jgi:hypothetical protein